ncbi:hypothetical protein HBI52_084990 [Parastagonospora nodorum]|nr:hypothetical protein HBH51_134350 [Parastagonospora nodorum]KAH4074140.1 hypothetical protein HBH50_043050 [Parastagonospora nodorum]KAH4091654.1 hypothetical protein HBH48_095370 [Parastagonospora nodorum]KAH4256089.1 hypothetical protein HBI03_169280 [Parastagonospora nodorum]KAH4864178.1 hypothetical protein HBH75_008210 [Parastagonospora nodorum]
MVEDVPQRKVLLAAVRLRRDGEAVTRDAEVQNGRRRMLRLLCKVDLRESSGLPQVKCSYLDGMHHASMTMMAFTRLGPIARATVCDAGTRRSSATVHRRTGTGCALARQSRRLARNSEAF